MIVNVPRAARPHGSRTRCNFGKNAMPKKVVLIGHCGSDSSYLRMAITAADRNAQVLSADDEQTLQKLLEHDPALLLLNRVIDFGFPETEGVQLIARLKIDHPTLKMMLVSNYEDAQADALNAGALPGFGKRELGTPRVTQLLRDAINAPAPPASATERVPTAG